MFSFKQIITLLGVGFALTLSTQAQAYFSGERLRQAVIAYATKTAGDDAEVLVAQKIADQGFQETGVSAKCTGSKESLRGVSYVAIEFSCAGRIVRRVQVPIQVKIYRDVAVATNTISLTSPITRQQYSIEKRDVTAYPESELLDASEINGTSARRSIQKGGVITRSSITEAGGIRRGMTTTVIVQAGSVIIRTRGAALNDATLGETVRVMREGTNSIVTGILQENRTVYIGNFGSTLSERE